MMTQEEVAQVIAYCEENKVSYKQRLDELGIAAWMFYDAKRKYAPKQEADNAGDFLQLVPGGTFFPSPIKPARSRGRRQKDAEQEAAPVNIELKTATGTMMRISGNLPGRQIQESSQRRRRMFSLGIEMRYWLYSEPTDMRKSFHTLTGLVTNRIGADARNGDVYVFINKRRNRVKLLH